MKHGTIDHPKMGRLMSRLKIPRNHAAGILEHLWHWAGRYAPQGDVGKYTDAQIEQEVAPEIKSGLVNALIEAKWVDRAPLPYRLIVHGWKEHADQRVRKWLARNELGWAEDLVDDADGTRTKHGQNTDNVRIMSGQCPDGVRTESGQCPDGVRPHARATEPEPEPEPEPEDGRAHYPDSFARWISAMASVPGHKKIKSPKERAVAERCWMEAQALAKNLPKDVVDQTWNEFMRKSLEEAYARPCSTWITFLRNGAPKEQPGGRFEQRPMTGAREVTGMATDVDLDEGDAAARAKKKPG